MAMVMVMVMLMVTGLLEPVSLVFIVIIIALLLIINQQNADVEFMYLIMFVVCCV